MGNKRICMMEYVQNDHKEKNGIDRSLAVSKAYDFHKMSEGYQPTPLVRLENLKKYGIGCTVYAKLEKYREGTKSFKSLGASYSMSRILTKKYYEITGEQPDWHRTGQSRKIADVTGPIHFRAATDGNHGAAVAWFADCTGHRATIYLPNDTESEKKKRIKSFHAEVICIDGTYDECVKKCHEDVLLKGGEEVTDIETGSNRENVENIILGYTTLFNEVMDASDIRFDTVFVPVGVGGLAAAAAISLKNRCEGIKIVAVEPYSADSLYRSVEGGRIIPTDGRQDSLMCGLNCGIVSEYAWSVLKRQVDGCVRISDHEIKKAAHLYEREYEKESYTACAAFAGFLEMCKRKQWKEEENVLVIFTE